MVLFETLKLGDNISSFTPIIFSNDRYETRVNKKAKKYDTSCHIKY